MHQQVGWFDFIQISLIIILNCFCFVFKIKIPISLLNQLNEASDWSEFLKYVDNVTVVEGETAGDTPYVYGAWEVDGEIYLNNF